ncbi:MAG: DUF6391 domain-containing protein [Caldilineaceae bacterium]
MIENLTDMVRRTRQHHAIEHATLHMLALRFPQQRFSGLSDPVGFTIFGELDEYTLRRAVGDALVRLQAGEEQLALHPNCGTNLVTTAALLALASLLVSTRRNIVERFLFTLFLILPVLVFSRNIGMHFQGYTTQANVSDRWLLHIHPFTVAGRRAHRVIFE